MMYVVAWRQIKIRCEPWTENAELSIPKDNTWQYLGQGGEGEVYALPITLHPGFVDNDNFVIKIFSTSESSAEDLHARAQNIYDLLSTINTVEKSDDHFGLLWQNVSFPIAWLADDVQSSKNASYGALRGLILTRIPSSAFYVINNQPWPATLDCLLKPGWNLGTEYTAASPMSKFNEYSAKQTWFLLRSLARTLYGIHSLGVVHGDLSPNNVYIRDPYAKNPEVFVIDAFNGYTEKWQSDPKIVPEIMWDPFSVSVGETSQRTDVFQIAWWIYMLGIRKLDWIAPTQIDIYQAYLDITDWALEKQTSGPAQRLADTLLLSLGDVDYRPESWQLYLSVHDYFTSLGPRLPSVLTSNGGLVKFADEGEVKALKRRFITGTVLEVCDDGVYLSVPGSELRAHIPNGQLGDCAGLLKNDLLGSKLVVKITSFSPRSKFVVASRLQYLQSVRERIHARTVKGMKCGDVCAGTVSGIFHNRAVVEVNGVYASLPLQEVSWRRVSDIADELQVGQRIRVCILKIDRNDASVIVSRKRLCDDPWLAVSNSLKPNDLVDGEIIRVFRDGVYVRLSNGVMVRFSESEFPAAVTGQSFTFRVILLDTKRLILNFRILVRS